MGNLFLSFTIAIGGAVGLVFLSRALDLDFYSSRIFPLIPIFYALAYQALERFQTGETRPIPPSSAREEMKAGAAAIFQHITVGRIFTAVGISIAIKIVFEGFFVYLFSRFSGKSFGELYGPFGIETIGRFLRGEHPWLRGNEGLALLGLLALVMSFGSGLWIGYTTKARAILEGVIAGAVVTMITAMTNMLILYRKIEEVANQMALSMGLATRIGFVAVLAFQVLLYGLWSGLARKSKEDRKAAAAPKKTVKRAKKQRGT